MVAISPPATTHKWGSISFASTLYLQPVLDLLLNKVPSQWQAELRLGLQEALVNSAKHGNGLDPAKTVSVRFSVIGDCHWWVITDQGTGFSHPCSYTLDVDGGLTLDTAQNVSECGRGLFILYQIFDDVKWSQAGAELVLCKRIRRWARLPLVG